MKISGDSLTSSSPIYTISDSDITSIPVTTANNILCSRCDIPSYDKEKQEFLEENKDVVIEENVNDIISYFYNKK